MTADLTGQVRKICMALPEVTERLGHGAPTYRAGGREAGRRAGGLPHRAVS